MNTMGLNLWLLVPVKPFGEGKSRLAAALNSAQRSALSRQLLVRLLSVANESGLFTGILSGILVVSRDDEVLRVAADADVETMVESGHGLNDALEAAREQVISLGADAILILPSDLPWITADDMVDLVAAGTDAASTDSAVVLAPSQDGGTNALFLRPPRMIEFSYGKESALRHAKLAEAQGLSVIRIESPTLAFDIDSPADFQRLVHAGL